MVAVLSFGKVKTKLVPHCSSWVGSIHLQCTVIDSLVEQVDHRNSGNFAATPGNNRLIPHNPFPVDSFAEPALGNLVSDFHHNMPSEDRNSSHLQHRDTAGFIGREEDSNYCKFVPRSFLASAEPME